MAELNWTVIDGINEADDSDADICARLNGEGNTEVACTAFGDVLVFELNGNIEFLGMSVLEELRAKDTASTGGSVVYLAVSLNGSEVLIGLDCDCGEVEVCSPDVPDKIYCESNVSYSPDEFDAISEYYGDLLDVMGLVEE